MFIKDAEEQPPAKRYALTLWPKYRSHKEVWALKIAEIVAPVGGDDARLIVPWDSRYAPFQVDGLYMTRHQPVVGGYVVVYADGYRSFSPAEAFEQGNTPIMGDEPPEPKTFTEALERLLNKFSMERDSNSPDFVLGNYLTGALAAFNAAVVEREQWYGRWPKKGE